MKYRMILFTLGGLAALMCSSPAEVLGQCDCAHHAFSDEHARPEAEITRLTNLPNDLPKGFSLPLTFSGQPLTLILEKNTVFGKNTRFLISDEKGGLSEIDLGEERAYLGHIAEEPSFAVSAILGKDGLSANIIRPGLESLVIEPIRGAHDQALHQIKVGESQSIGEQDLIAHSVTSLPHIGNEEMGASVGKITVGILEKKPTSGNTSKSTGSSTATLPPSRVMDVLEYEIGVEIGSRAFISDTYNSNLATAQASAQSIVGNLDARYLHSAGIKHRLGTVIIRTNASTDPLRDTVTATGAAANASSSLSAFRNYWNSNPGEVGNTHDLAVYHVKSAPSGLAYVNSVGSSNRYATCGGNGATSWANGTLAHEFGHSWSLGHYDASKGNFYESKPRNGNGSSSAGGDDVFVCVMHGGGDHNIGRLSTGEANQVYNVRQQKRSFGDIITNPSPIKPFGNRDDATATGNPITIDVISNDYDSNNDVLDVHLLDTVSQQGGTISLSTGTGPGGRNEVIYTPPAGANGIDFFHYTVCDSTGRTDWAAVYVSNSGPAVVDLTLTKYFYDLGTQSSILFSGNDDPYQRLSNITFGDLGFTSDGANPIESRDRGSIAGVNDLNRDHIRMRSPGFFHHKLASGIYDILFTIGDATENSNPIRLTAETNTILTTASHDPQTFTNYVLQDVPVGDGELNINIENLGFSSNITRIVITKVGNLATDSDGDNLLDAWELQFFGNTTSTSGLPHEDEDNDGLTDREEFTLGTSPINADTDGDQLSDRDELNTIGTDPNDSDHDNDGFSDGTEIAYRSDPKSASSKPIVSDLVAYYTFDEGSGTTVDNLGSAGSAADAATEQGTIGWTTTGQKIGGASLSLNGSSSLLADSPIPSSANQFSISVWVNPEADGGYKGIYSGRGAPGNWGVNIESSHADVRFANSANTSLGVDTAANSVVASGGWYHIAQTWISTASGTVGKVYLNGTLVGTTTAARSDFSQPTNGFFIGDDPCCGGREFNGQIDDLAVLTRVLSPSEISNIYTTGQVGGSIVQSLAPTFPSPQASFVTANSNSGDVVFQFESQANALYRIYSSPDLRQWTLLDSVMGTGPQFFYSHPNAANETATQFYRIE